jgi:DNA-binding response OmpR family regulator
MRVFLVDDDLRQRRLLGRVIRRHGWEVVGEAADGAEALALLSGLEVDLIITDCQMPQLDGLSLCRRLRRLGMAAPVIMVSGQRSTQVRRAALAAGAAEYLLKPVAWPQLQAIMTRLITLSASAAVV